MYLKNKHYTFIRRFKCLLNFSRYFCALKINIDSCSEINISYVNLQTIDSDIS